MGGGRGRTDWQEVVFVIVCGGEGMSALGYGGGGMFVCVCGLCVCVCRGVGMCV